MTCLNLSVTLDETRDSADIVSTDGDGKIETSLKVGATIEAYLVIVNYITIYEECTVTDNPIGNTI